MRRVALYIAHRRPEAQWIHFRGAFGGIYGKLKTMGEKGDTGLQSFAETFHPKVDASIKKLLG